MFRKTFECSLLFGFLLVLFSPDSVWAKPAAPMSLSVSISLYNEADVGTATLTEAEATAARVFQQVGFEVNWVNCGLLGESQEQSASCSQAVFPTHLQLRILRRSRNLTNSTAGISYLSEDGTGCYGEVFFAHVLDLHERFHQSAAVILGHVMAHEVAHLLLGTNSHSSAGIMQARWQRQELENASRGRLLFTHMQSQTMKETLFAAWRRAQRNSASPNSNSGS